VVSSVSIGDHVFYLHGGRGSLVDVFHVLTALMEQRRKREGGWAVRARAGVMAVNLSGTLNVLIEGALLSPATVCPKGTVMSLFYQLDPKAQKAITFALDAGEETLLVIPGETGEVVSVLRRPLKPQDAQHRGEENA
jgi:hypothetical protein